MLFIGALLSSAAGSAASSAIGFGFGQASAKKAFSRQVDILQNRYQWQVADLKAAGLNPILAVSQPPPAPGVPIGGYSSGGESLVSSAKQLSKLSPEMKLLHQQLKLMNAETQRTQAVTRKEDALGAKEVVNVLRARKGLQFDQARIPAALAQQEMDETTAGKYLRWFNRFMQSIWGRETQTGR